MIHLLNGLLKPKPSLIIPVCSPIHTHTRKLSLCLLIWGTVSHKREDEQKQPRLWKTETTQGTEGWREKRKTQYSLALLFDVLNSQLWWLANFVLRRLNRMGQNEKWGWENHSSISHTGYITHHYWKKKTQKTNIGYINKSAYIHDIRLD